MGDARHLDVGSAANPPASLVNAQSAAATANATSGAGQWLNTTQYEGDLLVVMNLGAITGGIVGQLQSASDANGTGAANIAGAAFAAGVANTSQAIVISKGSLPAGSPYIGFVGTITTGPVLVGVTAIGRLKYS